MGGFVGFAMRRFSVVALVLVLALLPWASAGAQEGENAAPEAPDVSDLRLPEGPVDTGQPLSEEPVEAEPPSEIVDPELEEATGPTEVVVQLEEEPLAVAVGEDASQEGPDLSGAEQRAYVEELEEDQEQVLAQADDLGAQELARLDTALNAVVVRVDASRIDEVADIPGVTSVRPVRDYELHLEETVPYIGAAEVQEEGFTGEGVRVAVLDSGVDYTHRNLGGPGTQEAYEAAYGQNPDDPANTTRDGLFPTEKVYDGFDFVGEDWVGAGGPERTEDPDPIDFEGHGTHVADIIAGKSEDGEHVGTAPDAQILAVKVCSALSSSCNGVALLKGVDYSLDPNGDGNISDAVDVINMSLGSSYGQIEDDLSAASANAVRLGTTVVASAGNSANRPYITGSPSTTPEVISVAQTQVPGAVSFPLVVNSPESIAGEYPNTATVDWAPIGDGFTGDVVYVGQACPQDELLADPSGSVALIDRGACAVSLKTDKAADAGAIGVLVANNVPGDPPSFSFGGGDNFVPTLIITQDAGQTIKDNIGAPVNVTVSPENSTGLEGSMVASSARGPNYSFDAIKPDIGAPGASVSAVAGSGDGEGAFGGTSGAAPMVAGSAAQLIDAYPGRSPEEIKAVLMNTGETDIETNPSTDPGELAPITRIGGGEVRVNRAADSNTAAWDAEEQTGSLSFGYHPMFRQQSFVKRVLVRNYDRGTRTYQITPRFRYAEDANSGAVSVRAPRSITVPGNASRIFDVRLTVDPERLPEWTLDGGLNGGDGSLLTEHEFDGYLEISDRRDDVHLAWHVLPHKAADVRAVPGRVNLNRRGDGRTNLLNRRGEVDGGVDVFSLTGRSPEIPASEKPGPGDNFAVIDLRAVGARLVSLGPEESGVQFAINTYGDRSHPNYPAQFSVLIDADRDGTDDHEVFNSELGGFAATGQNVVNVRNLETGESTASFFTDADLNSANAILTAPLEALGLTPNSTFDFRVLAVDNYFTGNLTDSIETMTYTPDTPKYFGSGVPPRGVPAGGRATLSVQAIPGGDQASPSQTGLLLLYRDALLDREAQTIQVRERGRRGR